jgi:hypothetical protein
MRGFSKRHRSGPSNGPAGDILPAKKKVAAIKPKKFDTIGELRNHDATLIDGQGAGRAPGVEGGTWQLLVSLMVLFHCPAARLRLRMPWSLRGCKPRHHLSRHGFNWWPGSSAWP